MGYNLKATYCDLASLEGTRVAAVSTILREDSSDQRHNTNFVDLNLGGQFVGEAGLTLTSSGFRFGLEGHKAPLMEPFSGGSSKRARVPSSTSQTVSCLVDGCKSDLSKCRDYHRRHKVCEMHSKTPKVTIGGHEQRFCQQCSRFHSLGEFDEGKRSCRKRLEGHNRRRRKPQPEPLPVNPGNFLSAGQGSRYMSFSNQAMIPASSVVSTTWSGSSSIKPDPNPSLFSTTSVSGSYSQPYRGGRQFPFLQPTDSSLAAPSSTLHQTTHTCSSGGGSDNNGSNNNVNHHLNHGLIDSSDHRALSLLSSSPVETPEMGLGQAIHQPSPINQPRPIISNLLYSSHEHEHEQQFHHNSQGLQQGHHHGGSGSALMRASNSHSLCQDVFQTGTDESSATAAHQTLSFSWE